MTRLRKHLPRHLPNVMVYSITSQMLPRKVGSAVVALSYWMSQRDKATFLKKLFTRGHIDS